MDVHHTYSVQFMAGTFIVYWDVASSLLLSPLSCSVSLWLCPSLCRLTGRGLPLIPGLRIVILPLLCVKGTYDLPNSLFGVVRNDGSFSPSLLISLNCWKNILFWDVSDIGFYSRIVRYIQLVVHVFMYCSGDLFYDQVTFLYIPLILCLLLTFQSATEILTSLILLR